jgi:hypothetical protein
MDQIIFVAKGNLQMELQAMWMTYQVYEYAYGEKNLKSGRLGTLFQCYCIFLQRTGHKLLESHRQLFSSVHKKMVMYKNKTGRSEFSRSIYSFDSFNNG